MKKSIAIELDKIRNLRFSTNNICQLEDLLGKPVSELQNGAGFKELRGMLYCGLKWEDQNLTLDQAGDIMDESMADKGIGYISEKLAAALQLALPDKKK
ncbi:hypothetical protein [Alkaliphilus transvaalensis]|uniref:hypothetical protein n=1 Tax=Alkaliphilus transvaalensis TaxID=114628 RepID=UPI0004791B8D|nr:hypothetical protein [Alkaliphilus transvaalensis]